jgi:hypothetical protein
MTDPTRSESIRNEIGIILINKIITITIIIIMIISYGQ